MLVWTINQAFSNNTIKIDDFVGLWLIEKVEVGTEQMTPDAKWIRLKKDSKQLSGNGWRQHTIGTWSLDSSKESISLVSMNGLKDPYGPFKVENISSSHMKWQRTEEEQIVTVHLKRIDDLPISNADKILGSWQAQSENNHPNLYFRPDQIVLSINQMGDRKFGTYKMHAHRNEVQIIFYGEKCEIENWNIDFTSSDQIKLKKSSDISFIEYNRIDHIP